MSNRNAVQEVFELGNTSSVGSLDDLDGLEGGKAPSGTIKQTSRVIRPNIVDDYVHSEIMNQIPQLKEQVEAYQAEYENFEPASKDIFTSFYKGQHEFTEDKRLDEIGQRHRQWMQQYMQTEEFQRLHAKTKHDSINAMIASRTAYDEFIAYIRQEQEEQGGGGQQPSNNFPKQMDKLAQDMQQMENIIQGYGLEDGEEKRLSFKEKKELLDIIRNSPKFKAFAMLVGRYRELAKKIFNRKEKVRSQAIRNITSGGDIRSVLPSELMLYKSTAARKLFLKRMLENQLLQYDRYDHRDKGQGPIVTCIDVSGSMSGEPEKWSKATALALLEMASLQKRDFVCIFFNSQVKKVVTIPYGTLKPAHVVEIAEYFPGGGTDFVRPLNKAFEIIGEKTMFRKADIVFITDGEAPIDDEQQIHFEALKAKHRTKIQTILIQPGIRLDSHRLEQYKQRLSIYPISDKFSMLSDFGAESEMTTEGLLDAV